MRVARELARREGILTGTSGGGVLAVALRKAANYLITVITSNKGDDYSKGCDVAQGLVRALHAA